MRNSRGGGWGLSYQSAAPTDVVFLSLRDVHFRVSSAVLGLFPDSVLMTMFPTGLVPLFSVVTGRDASTTVGGLRLSARAAAQSAVTQALEARRVSDSEQSRQPVSATGGDTTGAAGTTPTNGDNISNGATASEQKQNKRASFAGGGQSLSKAAALQWHKYYNSESGAQPNPDAEDDMESLSDTDSEDGVEGSAEEGTDSSAPAVFRPAEDSMRMDLSHIEGHKMCVLDFDPRLFQFLLDYFREVLNRNHDAMVSAQEEKERQIQEANRAAEKGEAEAAAGSDCIPAPDSADPNGVEVPQVTIAPPTNDESHDSDRISPLPVEISASKKEIGDQAGAPKTEKRRASIVAPFNFKRRLSDLKLSIVTLFTGVESRQTYLGPEKTPRIENHPDLSVRPIHSVIMLREELEFFPIPKWAVLSNPEDEKLHGMWENLKRRVRHSFSRASSKGLYHSESAPMVGSSQGVEMADVKNHIVNVEDHLSHFDGTQVKRACGEQLIKQRNVVKQYAEHGVDLFEKGEREMLAAAVPVAEEAAPSDSSDSSSSPRSATKLPKRERVVCEMEEQIMKRQLVAALQLFSDDLKHDGTNWDFRELELGKCKLSSVSMLKMREMEEIQADIQADVNLASESAKNSTTTNGSTVDGEQQSGDAASGAAATIAGSAGAAAPSLITQVSQADTPAAVHNHHLNQHLLLKRPVRKCWWETMTIRIDSNSAAKSAETDAAHRRQSMSAMPKSGRRSSVFGGRRSISDDPSSRSSVANGRRPSFVEKAGHWLRKTKSSDNNLHTILGTEFVDSMSDDPIAGASSSSGSGTSPVEPPSITIPPASEVGSGSEVIQPPVAVPANTAVPLTIDTTKPLTHGDDTNPAPPPAAGSTPSPAAKSRTSTSSSSSRSSLPPRSPQRAGPPEHPLPPRPSQLDIFDSGHLLGGKPVSVEREEGCEGRREILLCVCVGGFRGGGDEARNGDVVDVGCGVWDV
ncbi:uncharacterized protein EV422DRAFT_502689 [Fimicolochytrium jonesii]|uniref:uncharacterized protein n=1 Tax=Fimicolochytrium jonesii TaxID=1396493 RepID=UPI0022FDF1F6|nr:uncharacterized protein EV422DRAFT_502689 [Fimicolochytrium jonesii]KAI8826970.1 hypothetical protein EV422DRAFT_502689 [Fimicolochytrium jonesii]